MSGPEPETRRDCPHCGGVVKAQALRCPHCSRWLPSYQRRWRRMMSILVWGVVSTWLLLMVNSEGVIRDGWLWSSLGVCWAIIALGWLGVWFAFLRD